MSITAKRFWLIVIPELDRTDVCIVVGDHQPDIEAAVGIGLQMAFAVILVHPGVAQREPGVAIAGAFRRWGHAKEGAVQISQSRHIIRLAGRIAGRRLCQLTQARREGGMFTSRYRVNHHSASCCSTKCR